ncbi:transporter [Thalassospira sp. HJ]|uniref:efflux RND transporter permease subunit n=1 Tax=Thalassospira sp. HJ TaxID=1616823 RepID=UPI0005CE19BD|nr:efflux RND transporter permease subunit [Thalassospira sp. HJ]KJE34038.1 transporter [Thalassospira sp. HJ]
MQNLSRFFVDRPIFAGVLSVLMLLAGLIAMWRLPISEYPEVVPPSIVVEAKFPGANPAEISETVASPLEEQINGVEGMLYINSLATTDGNLSLTVTFEIGTDPDLAQQKVQNRVSQAEPRLPDIVRQLGVTVAKRSPDLTMVVHLRSPNERYDMLYLRNYATLNVRDRLARINGVGQVGLFGSGDYAMRVWLNPDKVAERNLTAGEVVSAIQSQNVQVAAGIIGGAPYDSGVQFQLPINISGRLESPEEFQNIIIKRETDGTITRLGDVARVEMEAQQYALRSLLDNKPAVAIPIFASPGSNALDISSNVRSTMEELKQNFPDDLDYSIVYDPTVFVRGSIKSVIKTLLEAIALVVIVVTVFLQTWRASIIPLLAVPVSIIGTFALMLLMGFSINVLSLFGLILAIGIVVDDAIVVVENVERNIERGLSPRDATVAAMREVTGPIIATSLVITGVFVPIAFISGLTGQFYQQFALTIAIATIISTINSLTLSPALSAVLLRGHDAPKDWLTRGMDFVFGWFFRGFKRFFNRSTDLYAGGVKRLLGVKAIMMALYVGLLALTYQGFQILPTGFVPLQDKQYLVSFAQLPQGATLDRTEDVIREMSDIALNEPGVESAVAFPGLSINGFVNSSSAGIVFVTLTDFAERTSDDLSGLAIAGKLQQKFGAIDEAFVAIFPAPPVQGLGTVGGFKLQVQDRSDQGYGALDDAMKQVLAKAWAAPELTGVFSSYNINVPQLQATLDRTKVQQLGIPVDEIFQTMQVYLGSMYVNDFNAFGRTYQVIAQADKPYRSSPEDILRLQTRNADGDMVPLGSVLSVSETFGPDTAMRYNAFRSADLNGNAAPGYSSGEAQAAITKILDETLPPGMSYEWTELTYQQILAGNTAIFVFPICILLVFLVLAAQYESLTMPLAVILIVPMSILSAVFGVYLFGGDNNIFTQISLFVLAGLASKNAILIVEFARELEHQGRSTLQAAIEASRLRLRPILMTSLAFIMGVVPLVLSSGAGAEMRHAIGIAVFSGMLGVTVFGLILTPVFYVLVRMIGRRNDVRELDGAGVDQPAE